MPPDTNRTNQDEGYQSHSSHLFTLRLWPAARADGQIEWRGKVEHVTSGNTHYFRDWAMLIEHLKQMLPKELVEATGERDSTTEEDRQ